VSGVRSWRAALAACAACAGCASASNVAVIATSDAPARSPTAAEQVQVMAETGLVGCAPLGRVGVTVARPSAATAPRFDALQNLRIAAARLGADEVRDVRFEDTDQASLSVTAIACARIASTAAP
jgi:hypothetical protein